MDGVTPFISPAFADGLFKFLLVLGAFLTLRFAYRYIRLRQIDKVGFHDPTLQRLHLRMQAEESRRLVSRTNMVLVYAVACGILTCVLGVYGYA